MARNCPMGLQRIGYIVSYRAHLSQGTGKGHQKPSERRRPYVGLSSHDCRQRLAGGELSLPGSIAAEWLMPHTRDRCSVTRRGTALVGVATSQGWHVFDIERSRGRSHGEFVHVLSYLTRPHRFLKACNDSRNRRAA